MWCCVLQEGPGQTACSPRDCRVEWRGTEPPVPLLVQQRCRQCCCQPAARVLALRLPARPATVAVLLVLVACLTRTEEKGTSPDKMLPVLRTHAAHLQQREQQQPAGPVCELLSCLHGHPLQTTSHYICASPSITTSCCRNCATSAPVANRHGANPVLPWVLWWGVARTCRDSDRKAVSASGVR